MAALAMSSGLLVTRLWLIEPPRLPSNVTHLCFTLLSCDWYSCRHVVALYILQSVNITHSYDMSYKAEYAIYYNHYDL